MLFIPVTVVEVTETSFSLGSQNVKTYIIGAYTSEEASALTETLKKCGGKIGKLDAGKLIGRTQDYFSNNPNSCDSFGGHVVDHNSAVTSVSYPNGIGHAGTATGTCGVCLQDAGTVSLTPIIVAKGYSVCMFGTALAFSNGYEIYHDALAVYESVYGDCELGIVFVLNDRYNGSDMRNNIASLGVCMDETMLLSNGQASMDFIMTYKKGVNEKPSGSDTTYGDLAVVISAYLLHKEDKAEGMQGTSHYVQDTDDLCTVKLPDGNGGVTDGKTSDDKYYIVSYNSIHGMIQSLGLN